MGHFVMRRLRAVIPSDAHVEPASASAVSKESASVASRDASAAPGVPVSPEIHEPISKSIDRLQDPGDGRETGSAPRSTYGRVHLGLCGVSQVVDLVSRFCVGLFLAT